MGSGFDAPSYVVRACRFYWRPPEVCPSHFIKWKIQMLQQLVARRRVDLIADPEHFCGARLNDHGSSRLLMQISTNSIGDPPSLERWRLPFWFTARGPDVRTEIWRGRRAGTPADPAAHLVSVPPHVEIPATAIDQNLGRPAGSFCTARLGAWAAVGAGLGVGERAHEVLAGQ